MSAVQLKAQTIDYTRIFQGFASFKKLKKQKSLSCLFRKNEPKKKKEEKTKHWLRPLISIQNQFHGVLLPSFFLFLRVFICEN